MTEHPALHPLLRGIDALNECLGRLAGLLAIALAALVFALVVARYGLGVGSIAAQEAVLWLHGALFLLGLAYALKHEAHVRVDIVQQHLSPRARAWLDLFGCLVFLLPFCVFTFWISWEYVAASWSLREGSREPGGLPAWYLIKALIPLSATLLFLQGLATALRALARVRGDGGA